MGTNTRHLLTTKRLLFTTTRHFLMTWGHLLTNTRHLLMTTRHLLTTTGHLMYVSLFVDLFVFYFNHHRIPTGSFPQNFVKIRLDLAEILRISKLDWEGEVEKGRG